ncbi:unnamed protein product [Rhizopus stolonifer]
MALSNRFFSNALRDMQRSMSLMDQSFFNDLSHRSPFGATNNFWDTFPRYPTTNIAETDQGFELQAEIPGYEKKDIQIELTDSRTLILRGSVKHESPQVDTTEASGETAVTKSDNKWIVNERSSGSFQRAFSFPVPIQADGIKANYDNGVLKMTIPKAGDEARKTIEID